MSKYEIARWLTPGLAPIRLVFTTFGGSAHGKVTTEVQDVDTGEWSRVDDLGNANGIPKCVGEQVSDETINRFTGDVS